MHTNTGLKKKKKKHQQQQHRSECEVKMVYTG